MLRMLGRLMWVAVGAVAAKVFVDQMKTAPEVAPAPVSGTRQIKPTRAAKSGVRRTASKPGKASKA